MKRTKQAYYRQNPDFGQTVDSSGVTFVIGEDIDYHQRTREYQRLQKEYLDEQVDQKKQIKATQNHTKANFDNQLLHNTHQRGQLELLKKERLHEVERAHDQFNLNQVIISLFRLVRGRRDRGCRGRRKLKRREESYSF